MVAMSGKRSFYLHDEHIRCGREIRGADVVGNMMVLCCPEILKFCNDSCLEPQRVCRKPFGLMSAVLITALCRYPSPKASGRPLTKSRSASSYNVAHSIICCANCF